MASVESSDESSLSGPHFFATTRWTMVLAAQGSDSAPAGKALASLCESYWYPLYAFVRRRGHGSHDAQDLTQAFFEKLLEKNYLADVVREKGKFRTFLLASLKHFLANEWDRGQALKRGGGRVPLSLDDTEAEARYRLEPANHLSADWLFERRRALTLLDQVLARLKGEMEEAGKGDSFDVLKDCLTQGKGETSFAELGARLGISEGAARVAAHRLRKRYRAVLREEIAQTVAGPAEVDDEIRHLISVLGRRGTSE
jgi:RNA polymerase sigma factor (sigma-70 family)